MGRGDGGAAVGAASPCASQLLLGCRCQPAPKTQQTLTHDGESHSSCLGSLWDV